MNVSDSSPTATSPGFVETVRLLAGAQKPPAKGSPAYSRFVNRKIGRVLAAAAFKADLTPNQVTYISAAFTGSAIVCIATVDPSPVIACTIALALLLGYAFDSADGQLARLRGGGSPAGEWLDHVVDSFKTSALHLAVLIGWYRFYQPDDRILLLPIAFTLLASVFFFTQILQDQLRRAHPAQAPAPADASRRAVLRSLVVVPTDYGVLCLTFFFFAWRDGFLAIYALLLAGTALFMLAALPKWYRETTTYATSRPSVPEAARKDAR